MSGVIEHKGYNFWSNVELVYDRVWDFLQETFPDDIIFPELFSVDFVVLNKNIPVEVQSTIVLNHKEGTDNARKIIAHTQFELYIEKQIKQNVENFGHCWFFFDSEYLRYLQNDLTRKSRINLDWLYQLMKDGMVNVFTVSYRGEITEISYKSFNFLSDISMTCKVGHEGDYRVLDRNKLKILLNLLKGYEFSSDELFKLRYNFSESNTKSFVGWLLRKGGTPREYLYGNILHSVGSLEFVNQVLSCDEEVKLTGPNKYILSVLGLFEVKGLTKGAVTCFSDKFDIGSYFPGYVHNEKKWEYLRGNYVSTPTLRKIITKKIDVLQIADQDNEIKHDKKENIRRVLLEKNNFTVDEITEYRTSFENGIKSGTGIYQNWLQKSNRSDKEKLYGSILQHSSNTHLLEEFFSRKEDVATFIRLKQTLAYLGITDVIKGGKNTKIKFVDKHNLSRLFEGYEKNMEFWESIRNKNNNYEYFWNLVYQKNNKQLKLIEFK